MLTLLIGLIVLCLIGYLCWWLINMIPLPQPIRVIATVLFVLIMLIALFDYFPVSLPHGRL